MVTSLLLPFFLTTAALELPDPSFDPRDEAAPIVRGELGERLDDFVGRLERLGFSGGVAVAKDGELLLCKGYGYADRSAGIRAGRSTVFPLGSITKHFTAAAILKLHMDEALALEDPLELWFEDVPDDKREITIHHLLSHTSGLGESAMTALGQTERDAFVRNVLATELYFAPGAGSSYSNLGYGILAAIVEKASAQPFEEYVRAALFEPLGMSHIGSNVAQWPAGTQAHGYTDGGDTGTLLESLGGAPGWGLLGAGGFQSTLEDVLRWNLGLDEASVLDRATIELMTTPHANRGQGFGMGYGCGIETSASGHLRIGHNGSNDVFSADFRRYPNDGVVIFAAGNDADLYCFDFTPDLERIVFGEDVPSPPLVSALEPQRLGAYAGTWSFGDAGSALVRVQGDTLVISSGDVLPSALLNPVDPRQISRRDALLEGLAVAYEAAFAGELEPLREMVDPQVPSDAFAEEMGGMIDAMMDETGPPEAVYAVSGRNRFGEIAIVAILEGEDGRQMIEYSFAERGIGSIRFLDEYPSRVVRPMGPEQFVAYDAASRESWLVRFELDEDGAPLALVLSDELGAEHRAHRR